MPLPLRNRTIASGFGLTGSSKGYVESFNSRIRDDCLSNAAEHPPPCGTLGTDLVGPVLRL
jgi:hypothetical protein